ADRDLSDISHSEWPCDFISAKLRDGHGLAPECDRRLQFSKWLPCVVCCESVCVCVCTCVCVNTFLCAGECEYMCGLEPRKEKERRRGEPLNQSGLPVMCTGH